MTGQSDQEDRYYYRALGHGEGLFGKHGASSLFWERLKVLRPRCFEALEALAPGYRELVDHPPSSVPWFFINPAALDFVNAWATDWNLVRSSNGLAWDDHIIRFFLTEVCNRTDPEWTECRKKGVPVDREVLRARIDHVFNRYRLSSLDPVAAERARQIRTRSFENAAADFLSKAIPEGLETQAEYNAVQRCMKLLSDAGARIDNSPPDWFNLFRFEDGWDPGEGETFPNAEDRILKRCKTELRAYLDRVARTMKPSSDDGEITLIKFRLEAFDWLVLRVIPEDKGKLPLSPATIRDRINPGSGCIDRTTIRSNTAALARFLDLEIPKLPPGPRPSL